MNVAKQAPGRGARVFGVLVLVGLAGALGMHLFATSAPPLARTVDLVERDPNVTSVVGSPASVSLVTTRRLRRDVLQALSGHDSVSVLSTVKGPKGEASFTLDARNVDGQGWAGTFAIGAPARSVLKDGQYVTEGGATILEGDFAPDGAPRIKKR